MDNKLKDALEAKDYYSAHQLYLAIAQRHCRSKRFEEAKRILKDGCLELCGRGEVKSAVDLGRRYIDTLALGRLPLIDIDAIGVHSVLTAVGKKSSDKDNLRMLADLVIKEHSYLLLVVFHSLLQVGAHKEAGMVLLKLDDAKEEWQLLGAASLDPHVILCITLAGLKARNFAAISCYLTAVIEARFPQFNTTIESPADELPAFIKVIAGGELQGDEDVLARCLNLCQVLFVIFQHRLTPTPSALTKPLQHYAGLLAKLRVSEDEIKSIEHSYLLQQQQESGAAGMGAGRPDLLANLFQSMMAQSGGSPSAAAPKRK